MRKLLRTSLLAIVALCCIFAVSGCGKDNVKAFKLNGDWYGDFGMYYTYVSPRGNEIMCECYDTKLHFQSDEFYSSHGTAIQIDYYTYGPYAAIYYKVYWTIEDGVITLSYRWANQWDTQIYNYELGLSSFYGYFADTKERFDLKKLTDYDWTITNENYRQYGYGCDRAEASDYYPGYGDIQFVTRAGAEKVELSDEEKVYLPQPREIRIGNRHAVR